MLTSWPSRFALEIRIKHFQQPEHNFDKIKIFLPNFLYLCTYLAKNIFTIFGDAFIFTAMPPLVHWHALLWIYCTFPAFQRSPLPKIPSHLTGRSSSNFHFLQRYEKSCKVFFWISHEHFFSKIVTYIESHIYFLFCIMLPADIEKVLTALFLRIRLACFE